MPIDLQTINVHSVIESVGPDWRVASDGYTDNDPKWPADLEENPHTYLSDAFWDNAKVTNPGDDSVRLFYRDSLGGQSVACIIAPHSANVDLSTAIGNPDTLERVKSSYSSTYEGDLQLYWGQLLVEETMPSFVRITSDWSYDFEHHYGIDYTSTVGPYTWNGTDVLEEVVSDWQAPLEPMVNDNEFYVGAVAPRGVNWDLGEPEVGVALVTIAVYQRIITTGDITGEYLGADRRFMGF